MRILQDGPLAPPVIAELAFHIEERLAGHPVGKQDHYLAALGGVTCLDIRKDGEVSAHPLSASASTLEELTTQTLLFYTGKSRKADEILEEQRRRSLEGGNGVVASLHRTKEHGLRIRAALERGDLGEFGALLHEHWENKKRRSARISDSLIDRWYSVAREAGAAGGKLVGAGGGGFLMLFCENGTKGSVRGALAGEGLRELSYHVDYEGAKVVANI